MNRYSKPRRFTKLLATALLLLPTTASLAVAAHSDWAVNEGGRMRVILMPGAGDGQYQGLLQVEPKEGWITYWREPGDSGIPPQIASTPDSTLTVDHVAYPVPKRIDTDNVRDVGYDAPVSFPLSVSGPANGKGQLRLTAFIGLCENICIPFQAQFAVDAPTQSDMNDARAVNEAMAMLPQKSSGDFHAQNAKLSKDEQALHFELIVPDTTDEPQLFITGDEGTLLLDYVITRGDGNVLSVDASLEDMPKARDPAKERWSVLAVAGDRSMETPLEFP